jgi:hypothetical protein
MVICQTVINIIYKTWIIMQMRNVIKTKSQKLITRFDSLTLWLHAHGSPGLMVMRWYQGFSKTSQHISFNPYSRASGRNGTITDAYVCHRFLFFGAMCLHLLRFPFVSFSLLKMNICYRWNWTPRLGLMPCLWFRLLWTKLMQRHAFKIFIPVKHYVI